MRYVVWFFIVSAAAGLIASLIVHASVLLGGKNPFGNMAWQLQVGAIVLGFPTVFIGWQLTKDFKQRDYWRAALRGCPQWLKYLTYGFFGYAGVNFVLFFLASQGVRPSEVPETTVFRGFSGHWMAFYSAELAVLYSSTRARSFDQGRRCPNGHVVSPLAKYCEECGQPVLG